MELQHLLQDGAKAQQALAMAWLEILFFLDMRNFLELLESQHHASPPATMMSQSQGFSLPLHSHLVKITFGLQNFCIQCGAKAFPDLTDTACS